MDVVSGPRLRAAEACLPVLVDATGKARLVITPGLPEDVAEDLRSAVLQCRWIPGTDPSGRPTDLWVVMPMRFSSH